MYFLGVIDPGFRGGVEVVLMNMGTNKFKIEKGDRICQLIIERYAMTYLMECKELKESIRDDKGFGSTGIKTIYMTTKEIIKKFRADFEELHFMPVANKAMSQIEK
jgi:gluconate kinase